jgi:YD repeat-containing protein
VEVKDALGFVTRLYREDPLWPGQVTRVRYQNGREVTSTFDEAGRLSSTTDWATSAGGRFATTLYEWDARCGAVSRVTLPEGEVSSRGYDARCRPEWAQTGPDAARRVTFGYRALSDASAPGLPASVTEPGGHTSTFGYDANGNLRFTTTPGNDTTTFVNDAIGRVLITRTPINRAQNLFQTDSAVYDARDRVIRADSYGPRMAVDALVTADSQRVVVETDFDQQGLARSVSRRTQPDPTGIGTLVTRWKHDALGRVMAQIAADSTPHTWDDNPRDTTAYNPAGLPVWTRTRRGDVLSSRYDAMGRPAWRHHTAVVYDSTSRGIPSRQRISSCLSPGNSPVEHVYPWYPTDPVDCTLRIPADSSVFAYDEMGNLRRAANGAATVRRGYLANGLLAADTLEIRTLSGGVSARAPYVLAYEYDLNGRRTALGHPGAIAPVANAVTRYAYDPATGALASVTDPLGNLFSYRYDARGQLDTVALPGGMRQSYDYDGSGRLSQYRASIPSVASGALLSNVTFQYDERGKMLESNDAGLGKEVMSAWYSGLGHLVRSAYSSSGTGLFNAVGVNQTTATMRYDPLGNGYHTENAGGTQGADENSLSNRENTSAYLPLTGRLRLNFDQTSTTHFAYDRAGNTVFEMTTFPGSYVQGRDRVSYYGGDGKLRVVDARADVEHRGVRDVGGIPLRRARAARAGAGPGVVHRRAHRVQPRHGAPDRVGR